MKFPYAMLRDFVETTLDAEGVGELLTMAGFELEGIEEVEGDAVLDIKVMANRGDGLSVLGLAREVLAKDRRSEATEHYRIAIAGFPMDDESTPDVADRVTVRIETPECPRYAVRLFEGVANAPAPEWMQKRLRQAGMRPLGVLVDLTNYIMLELGQPLHAFDHAKVGSTIVVRNAREGDRLTTLNGVEHALRSDQMMICDAEKPVATPGIMGGLETEVTDATTSVLLESANFTNTAIRRIRKQLGLASEASYRFERSVDPEGVVRALNRYAGLLAEAGFSEARVPGVLDVYPGRPNPPSFEVRLARAETLLGVELQLAETRGYLDRLGFHTSDDGLGSIRVTAPTWRPDVVREEDAIEEIGRVHGYDRIPEALPVGSTTRGGVHGITGLADRVIERALRLGFDQTISYSLRGEHRLDGPGGRIGPRNPHSPESAWLRNSLLPGLAEAAQRNGGRDQHRFEAGHIFGVNPSGRHEWSHFALLSTGRLAPEGWSKADPGQASFFTLKAAVESCMAFGDLRPEFQAPQGDDSRLHPTRRADVFLGGQWVGILGQLHPDAAADLDFAPETIVAEFCLEFLLEASERAGEIRYRPISRNPSVRRDIAFLIEKSVPYAKIDATLKGACGDVLEHSWLFDVYDGKGIPEGAHSLAVALQLRKFGENFTDEEANQVRDRAVAALESLGATQR